MMTSSMLPRQAAATEAKSCWLNSAPQSPELNVARMLPLWHPGEDTAMAAAAGGVAACACAAPSAAMACVRMCGGGAKNARRLLPAELSRMGRAELGGAALVGRKKERSPPAGEQGGGISSAAPPDPGIVRATKPMDLVRAACEGTIAENPTSSTASSPTSPTSVFSSSPSKPSSCPPTQSMASNRTSRGSDTARVRPPPLHSSEGGALLVRSAGGAEEDPAIWR
mmetsp:Transcript_35099/g.86069  ORF Transcript_35099/g.86069 Transcript_35099/m.86069 type:complete len:225 (+) Transcript_35099:467-1141(+)